MERTHKLLLIAGLPSFSLLLLLSLSIVLLCRRKKRKGAIVRKDVETSFDSQVAAHNEMNGEDLFKYEGGEDLTVDEILEAPGEVIGKSSYGTLYRAVLVGSNSAAVLRFLRPTCTLGGADEVVRIVELLGRVRHPNLVPLRAFYAGPRGEKLMVHPFYSGNLAEFIRGGTAEARKWPTICRISVAIAKGIHHLHTSFSKPIVHGNLKSKNVLLDRNYHPYVSDYGLHLLLNPTAAQQMLEASSLQGYKAPELIKMKDASPESDVYSLGLIFLELLTGKEPIEQNPARDRDSNYLPSATRNAILDDRIGDVYHPDILSGLGGDRRRAAEDRVIRYFQLAMACCSPSRFLRPHVDQVLEKLEEIGTS